MRLLKALRAILSRRKRRPTLVIPTPEIGPRDEHLMRLFPEDHLKLAREQAATTRSGKDEIDEDDFLWPPPDGHRGLHLFPPPHSEWARRYSEVRDGHITYDADQAQTRLLQHISSDSGNPISRFVIEPIQPEPGIFRTSTEALNNRHKKGN